jgi:predicted DNA-binding protein YlxM (UPF0122 family)
VLATILFFGGIVKDSKLQRARVSTYFNIKPMSIRDKCVYRHIRSSDGEVFYIGMGNKYRPYHKDSNRSAFWNSYVKKYGEYEVEILCKNLTKEEAYELEIALISFYGRRVKKKGNLVNLSNGGENSGDTLNKKVICLNSGILYDSITFYCEAKQKNHSTISMFLCGKNSTKYNVRYVVDNKIQWELPNGKYKVKTHENIQGIDIIETNYDIKSDNDKQQKINYINNKIRKLNKKDKNLLRLKHTEDLSFRQIASKTGIGTAAIYNRYIRIIKFIKDKDIKKVSPYKAKTWIR